jgi:hypothetical protein
MVDCGYIVAAAGLLDGEWKWKAEVAVEDGVRVMGSVLRIIVAKSHETLPEDTNCNTRKHVLSTCRRRRIPYEETRHVKRRGRNLLNFGYFWSHFLKTEAKVLLYTLFKKKKMYS